MLKKQLTLAACAFALTATAAHAGSSEIFLGGSAGPDSLYGYIGGVTAIGHTLETDGILARASTGYGSYNYNRQPISSVEGNVSDSDLMVGYQMFFPGTAKVAKPNRLSLYAGGNYINQDTDRFDGNNSAVGEEWGIKGLVETHINICPQAFVDLAGSYSSAFDTYWSNVRVGYNAGGFSVGPEASFLGNEEFDQQRYGAFIGDIALASNTSLTVAGGYADAGNGGDDGVYGDVSVGFAF